MAQPLSSHRLRPVPVHLVWPVQGGGGAPAWPTGGCQARSLRCCHGLEECWRSGRWLWPEQGLAPQPQMASPWRRGRMLISSGRSCCTPRHGVHDRQAISCGRTEFFSSPAFLCWTFNQCMAPYHVVLVPWPTSELYLLPIYPCVLSMGPLTLYALKQAATEVQTMM